MTVRPGTPGSHRLSAAFLRACALDVAVRKPGNVSLASIGHGMQAAQFLASARAAAGPLLQAGTAVGRRIDAAGAATWGAAGCNTNLGILLLCAPLAAAAQQLSGPCTAASLQHALQAVLAGLTTDDACAAYHAIQRANPGGLGQAETQDVQAPPSINLRAAMALAAHRDSIARQYANGFTELFQRAFPLLAPGLLPLATDGQAPATTTRQVQRLWLPAWRPNPIHTLLENTARHWHTLSCARRSPGSSALRPVRRWMPTRPLPPGTTASSSKASTRAPVRISPWQRCSPPACWTALERRRVLAHVTRPVVAWIVITLLLRWPSGQRIHWPSGHLPGPPGGDRLARRRPSNAALQGRQNFTQEICRHGQN